MRAPTVPGCAAAVCLWCRRAPPPVTREHCRPTRVTTAPISRDQVIATLEGPAEVAFQRSTSDGPASLQDLAAYPNDLHIFCIDDSAAARRLLRHNLLTWAQTPHVHVYGEDEADAAAFVEAALQRADIAILDQHLEYGGSANVLGTDLVAELVTRGYRGLVCMRSANVADEDMRHYRAVGAHCTFGKDCLMRDMIEEMKGAYVRCICAPDRSSSAVLSESTSFVAEPV